MMTITAPITQKQIELVENSWDFILTSRQEAGFCFYKSLFEIDPNLKRLFNTDLEEQAQKLISLITFVVHKLNNINSVLADVRSLGVRHRGYHVQPDHYKAVEIALLRTLSQSLGEQWNQETEEAWTAVYALLSETMISAANEV